MGGRRPVLGLNLPGGKNCGQGHEAGVRHPGAAREALVHYPVEQGRNLGVELEQQNQSILSKIVNLQEQGEKKRRNKFTGWIQRFL